MGRQKACLEAHTDVLVRPHSMLINAFLKEPLLLTGPNLLEIQLQSESHEELWELSGRVSPVLHAQGTQAMNAYCPSFCAGPGSLPYVSAA